VIRSSTYSEVWTPDPDLDLLAGLSRGRAAAVLAKNGKG
jgi:hypothetical protein